MPCDYSLATGKHFGKFAIGLSTVVFVVSFFLLLYSTSRSRTFGGDYLVNKISAPFQAKLKTEPQRSPVNKKTILLWTNFFSKKWEDHFSKTGSNIRFSDHKVCHFTVNRTYLNKADALVFHGRDFDFHDIPSIRHPWQRWIYYLLESPMHSGFSADKWSQLRELNFNWSMTYSQTADVYAPYGEIRSQKQLVSGNEAAVMDEKIANFSQSFWKRQRDAVWIVSNCVSSSRREFITKVLTDHGIQVDSWGRCSGKSPDQSISRIGSEMFFSQYRFYLSFENSLCDDYISEKGYQGLYYSYLSGSIPIVYGGGDYDKMFPNGSFINAQAYNTVSDMAKHLRALSCPSSADEVATYYQWFKTVNPLYEIGYELYDNRAFIHDYSKRVIWRNLCQKLWKENSKTGKYSTTVSNMENRLGKCHNPKTGFIDEDDLNTKNIQKYYKVNNWLR